MKALIVALIAGVLAIAAPASAAQATPKQATLAQVAQTKAELVDINRAGAEELMTLKGIGPIRAKAIIKGRPYARKDELVQRKIIPASVYNEIRERIIAKQ